MAILKNKHRDYDPTWHVQAVMVVAIVLQLLLPNHFMLGTYWLTPGIELLLTLALGFLTPKSSSFVSVRRRVTVLLLIAVTALGNTYALYEVADRLLTSGAIQNGRELIIAAVNIYLTNIIIFALLFWEMDGGGPGRRHTLKAVDRDFLFPQSGLPDHAGWRPTYIDYLYIASTNATAFSPTDTLPLSRRAKLLMLFQSIVSLIVVALVAARAVNILG